MQTIAQWILLVVGTRKMLLPSIPRQVGEWRVSLVQLDTTRGFPQEKKASHGPIPRFLLQPFSEFDLGHIMVNASGAGTQPHRSPLRVAITRWNQIRGVGGLGDDQSPHFGLPWAESLRPSDNVSK